MTVSTVIHRLSSAMKRLCSCAKPATLTGLRSRMYRTPACTPATSARGRGLRWLLWLPEHAGKVLATAWHRTQALFRARMQLFGGGGIHKQLDQPLAQAGYAGATPLQLLHARQKDVGEQAGRHIRT